MTAPDVAAAAGVLRARVSAIPPLAIVLGSGLGALAGNVEQTTSIPYTEIPGWPAPRVPGHEGRLIVGRLRRHPVTVLSGRTHLYEGVDPAAVTFGVRVLGALGVRVVILTSACGAIDTELVPGSIVAIDDHLNMTGANPIVGWSGPETPFVDMTEAYSMRLRTLADRAAAAAGIRVVHGVYAGVLGPTYETPAEVRALRALGASVVGMSVVHETIVARHLGMEVLGFGIVTNPAAGAAPGVLRHDDVVSEASQAGPRLAALLEAVVEGL